MELTEVGNREAGFLWHILHRFAFPANAARLKLPLTLAGRQRF
jgi:hypothetical protein